MNDSDAVMAMLLGVAKLVRSTKMLRKVAKVFSKDLACSGYCRYSFQNVFVLKKTVIISTGRLFGNSN